MTPASFVDPGIHPAFPDRSFLRSFQRTALTCEITRLSCLMGACFSAQESLGEQYGALERPAAVVARAHRMGDQEGHRAHRPGARLRRRGGATKTTSKSRATPGVPSRVHTDYPPGFLPTFRARSTTALPPNSSQFVQTPVQVCASTFRRAAYPLSSRRGR